MGGPQARSAIVDAGRNRAKEEAIRGSPSLVPSPGREDVVAATATRRSLAGSRVRRPPRDAARQLELRAQPVFSPEGETLDTVSHDGTAIAWTHGRSRSADLSRSRHDRAFRRPDSRPPGRQPRRPVDRGRPRTGASPLGCARAHAVGAPCGNRTVRSIARLITDGKTLDGRDESGHTLGSARDRSFIDALRGKPSLCSPAATARTGGHSLREQRPRKMLWDAATETISSPGSVERGRQCVHRGERHCVSARRCDDRVRPEAARADRTRQVDRTFDVRQERNSYVALRPDCTSGGP